jgi:ABC-2 type transport system ATP-binding protein
MFGLLGSNGSGKSSLMRTLATLQQADSGTAMLDDIDVLNDKSKVRKNNWISASRVWGLSQSKLL